MAVATTVAATATRNYTDRPSGRRAGGVAPALTHGFSARVLRARGGGCRCRDRARRCWSSPSARSSRPASRWCLRRRNAPLSNLATLSGVAVDQADLRRSELLGCLPPAALDTLAERARRRRYAAGETVFEEGAPGDAMHPGARRGCSRCAAWRAPSATSSRASARVSRSVSSRCSTGRRGRRRWSPSRRARPSRSGPRTSTRRSPRIRRRCGGCSASWRGCSSTRRDSSCRTTGCSSGASASAPRTSAHSQLEIVHRLGQVAELHDPETGRHITRMSRVCAHLGKVIGLPPAPVRALLLAAPMHDIGKVGVPDSILHKPGPLDDGEREPHAPAHDQSGCRDPLRQPLGDRTDGRGDRAHAPRALGRFGLPARVCAGPRSRWWDGSAPSATSSTRCVSARSYKHAWSIDEALAELEREAGALLDPDLVTALLRHARRAPPADRAGGGGVQAVGGRSSPKTVSC